MVILDKKKNLEQFFPSVPDPNVDKNSERAQLFSEAVREQNVVVERQKPGWMDLNTKCEHACN